MPTGCREAIQPSTIGRAGRTEECAFETVALRTEAVAANAVALTRNVGSAKRPVSRVGSQMSLADVGCKPSLAARAKPACESPLSRAGLQDAERRPGRDNAPQTESGGYEQPVVLFLGALPCLAAKCHHCDIEDRDGHVRLAWDWYHLDDEQTVAGIHRFAAPREYCPALGIWPVVQNLAHDPDISANGHRLEEAAARQLAPVTHSPSFQQVVSVRQHVRPVEQNAPNPWIRGNDGSHERAGSRSDIDD